MSTMESKQLATTRRLCKAVERIADVLERQEAPVLIATAQPGEVTPFALAWRDAVLVLSETCKGAEGCAEGACPMHEWCQKVLGEDAPAPAGWAEIEDKA